MIARIYAEKLAEHFKQSFVVENMPGAASSRGAGFVARAEPDGYTLFLGSSANAVSQSAIKRMNFDFASDLVAIVPLGLAPTVLVVDPALRIHSVGDLIALAKSKPEQVFYASAGVGTVPHLAGEMMNQIAGVKMVHVPYKGNNEAMADLIGGRIQANFSPLPTVNELMKAGQIKGLAVGSAKRTTLAPNLPTLAESGVAGFEAVIWYGYFAPKGTPAVVVDAITDVIARAAATPEIKSKLTLNGVDPLHLTTDAFATFVSDDIAKWRKIVQDAGINME
jgi:tripartite-type tricarboxylate transporter receptor subunit TctC